MLDTNFGTQDLLMGFIERAKSSLVEQARIKRLVEARKSTANNNVIANMWQNNAGDNASVSASAVTLYSSSQNKITRGQFLSGEYNNVQVGNAFNSWLYDIYDKASKRSGTLYGGYSSTSSNSSGGSGRLSFPSLEAQGRTALQTGTDKKSWWEGFSWNKKASDTVHLALDIVGFVPVVGEAADVANAAIYVAEEDYESAAISIASAVGGDAAKFAKPSYLKYARAIEAASSAYSIWSTSDSAYDYYQTYGQESGSVDEVSEDSQGKLRWNNLTYEELLKIKRYIITRDRDPLSLENASAQDSNGTDAAQEDVSETPVVETPIPSEDDVDSVPADDGGDISNVSSGGSSLINTARREKMMELVSFIKEHWLDEVMPEQNPELIGLIGNPDGQSVVLGRSGPVLTPQEGLPLAQPINWQLPTGEGEPVQESDNTNSGGHVRIPLVDLQQFSQFYQGGSRPDRSESIRPQTQSQADLLPKEDILAQAYQQNGLQLLGAEETADNENVSGDSSAGTEAESEEAAQKTGGIKISEEVYQAWQNHSDRLALNRLAEGTRVGRSQNPDGFAGRVDADTSGDEHVQDRISILLQSSVSLAAAAPTWVNDLLRGEPTQSEGDSQDGSGSSGDPFATGTAPPTDYDYNAQRGTPLTGIMAQLYAVDWDSLDWSNIDWNELLGKPEGYDWYQEDWSYFYSASDPNNTKTSETWWYITGAPWEHALKSAPSTTSPAPNPNQPAPIMS